MCGAIKQNESENESEKNKNSFHFSVYASRAKSRWKPHENWAYSSRDIVILVMLKTIKYKRNWELSLAVSKNQ